MTSIYLTGVVGDGSRSNPYRANVTGAYACLVLDPARKTAVVLAASDALPPPAVRLLTGAASPAALQKVAQNTSPTPAQRNLINDWLGSQGEPLLPVGAHWLDVVNYVARRFNPVASLGLTRV